MSIEHKTIKWSAYSVNTAALIKDLNPISVILWLRLVPLR